MQGKSSASATDSARSYPAEGGDPGQNFFQKSAPVFTTAKFWYIMINGAKFSGGKSLWLGGLKSTLTNVSAMKNA